MKIRYVLAVVVALASGWGAAILMENGGAKTETGRPGLLFVQSVTGGGFDGEILTVKEESPLILYFSERPDRFIGHMTAERFLRLWSEGRDSFTADPPNAVLSVLNEKGVSNITLELVSPAAAGGTWKYRVKVLSGILPKSFGAASLFIDAFPAAAGTADKQTPGAAPAIAMGNLYQSTSQSLVNAAQPAAAQSGAGASTVYLARP